MRNRAMINRVAFRGLILFMMIGLIGCGGAGTPPPTVERIPTPQGVFAQATTVLTPLPAVTVPATGGDPVAGQTIYANKCASCHGANGEGVEGKGKGVAGWTMTAAEFEDILRTGGKGKLGNEHLFGPLQISPSGMENLYVFVQTLLKK